MAYLPILLFALMYAGAVLVWSVPALLVLVYVGASVAAFIAYARDKAAARTGQRRTPERTLLLMGLACGWPGAILAQQWLHHKSRKASFQARFWATVALNAALFGWLAVPR